MNDHLDTPAVRELSDARIEAWTQVLTSEITRDEVQARRAQRRRRRTALVLVPAALLAAAGTRYAFLQAEDVVSTGIACYEEASMGGNVTVISPTGESPAAMCAHLAEQGVLHAGTTEVSGFTACVTRPGSVHVFPSTDPGICSDLGLEPLPDGYEEAARRFVAMRDAAVAALYRTGTADGTPAEKVCLDADTAISTVRRVLDEHGFAGWSVALRTGDYRDRTCANTLSVEDHLQRVWVIPSEPGVMQRHL